MFLKAYVMEQIVENASPPQFVRSNFSCNFGNQIIRGFFCLKCSLFRCNGLKSILFANLCNSLHQIHGLCVMLMLFGYDYL